MGGMIFFDRKIRPVAILLGACLALFLLKSRELNSLDREIAPALAELTHGQAYGVAAFSRQYMSDPYGKAVGLSQHELQLCRNLSSMVPAYQSAAAWRNNALFVGVCALLFFGFRHVTSNQGYRFAAESLLRRMSEKTEPLIAKARQRAAARATPHAVHNIVACPRCPQKLRIPAGKGRIRVTCSACGANFECLT